MKKFVFWIILILVMVVIFLFIANINIPTYDQLESQRQEVYSTQVAKMSPLMQTRVYNYDLCISLPYGGHSYDACSKLAQKDEP